MLQCRGGRSAFYHLTERGIDVAKFHDVLSGVSVEDGYPETFADDISAAYDEDISIPGAKIAELEAANAVLIEQIAELKARNYDLLTAVPASNEGGDEGGDEDSDEDSDDDASIDGLFEDKD